ncbi:unnamed protein product [Heligmosomoides polygyrus]|uniref:Uncharacterized protein n=1 Tax=Heligmosomoides polygyrus TaxID=6339 RepID=A0A183F3C6_HELPZ|nr:unnamed protein product [Heligmosomoides polygyrus]
MDDIEWIREEAPADEATTATATAPEALASNDVPQQQQQQQQQQQSSSTTDAAKNGEEEATEIPVKIEPKSTEVRFVPEPDIPATNGEEGGKRDGPVSVEICDPTCTTVPAYVPVSVEVFPPDSTTVPAYVPVSVEIFSTDSATVPSSASTEVSSNDAPVVIDHTTPEIKEEARPPIENNLTVIEEEKEDFDISRFFEFHFHLCFVFYLFFHFKLLKY